MRNWNANNQVSEKWGDFELPDYLWGIETWLGLLGGSICLLLPDYLWGIETFLFVLWLRDNIASRLPMRNWNRTGPARWDRRSASRLPMRNWNSITVFRASSVVSLPDYLWGIETSFNTPVNVGFESFQTTYEELKLLESLWNIEFATLPDYLWGIETRLAQHKRLLWQLPDYLWGIETAVRADILRNRNASRLPMRNWNYTPETSTAVECVLLPDYLWGIETERTSGISRRFSRFQTTYEELKLIRSDGTCQKLALPDYLWGIETTRIVCGMESDIASRLPMRNWNPVILSSLQYKNRFQTTYEELKPG